METTEEETNKTPATAATSNAADIRVESKTSEVDSCDNAEEQNGQSNGKTTLSDEEVSGKDNDQTALLTTADSDIGNGGEEKSSTTCTDKENKEETAEPAIDNFSKEKHVSGDSSPNVPEVLEKTCNTLHENMQENHFGEKESAAEFWKKKYGNTVPENSGSSNHGNATKPVQLNPSNQTEIIVNYLHKIVFPAVLDISKRCQINSVSDLEKMIVLQFVGDRNNEDTDSNQTCVLPTNHNFENATAPKFEHAKTCPVISEVHRLTLEIDDWKESTNNYKSLYKQLCAENSTITKTIEVFYEQVQKTEILPVTPWTVSTAIAGRATFNEGSTISYVLKLCDDMTKLQSNYKTEINQIQNLQNEEQKLKNQVVSLNRKLEKFHENMKVTKVEYENKIKEIESQKRNFAQQNKNLTDKLDMIQARYWQENNTIRKTIEAAQQELEKTETSSTISRLLSNVSIGRATSEDSLTSYVKKFSDYIKHLHKKTTEEYLKKFRNEESQKNNYMAQLAQQNKELEDQLDKHQKLLRETNILINKITDLEKSIEQQNQSLKKQQNEIVEIRNRSKRDLETIKKTIRMQEDSLTTKREKFNSSLKEISDKVKTYTTRLSLDDIKLKAEKNIIVQAVKKISDIQGKVKKYEDQISAFRGDSENKTYLDIKDILIRAIEKLDSIESQKKEEIQRHRRDAISYINHWHHQLEIRVHHII